MKNKFLFLPFFLMCFAVNMFAQEEIAIQEKYAAHNKGKFFVMWGGNRESYSKSDVTFKGKDYNFTVDNMTAHDKPKGWHIDYINPANMTIPQTNLRFGYFISDHYSIAIGVDHMKYVMSQDQTANVTGFVDLPEDQDGAVHNGIYKNTPVNFTDETFLTYEHTDGLNYINTEFSRHDDVSKWLNLPNIDKFQINLTEGIGGGVLYPKTNTKLLGKDRHDDFHISGYGISAKAGLNLTFYKHFYIQGELKGGYIDMHDIKTTVSNEDSASQHFMYFQRIIAVGGIFRI